MPQSAPARAVEIAASTGAVVRLTDTVDAAFVLMERLRAEGLTVVHPFDDPDVIAGQGTLGLELAEDAGELTDVLVSIGGGALISGVAAALRARRPGVRVWGVETRGAEAMSCEGLGRAGGRLPAPCRPAGPRRGSAGPGAGGANAEPTTVISWAERFGLH